MTREKIISFKDIFIQNNFEIDNETGNLKLVGNSDKLISTIARLGYSPSQRFTEAQVDDIFDKMTRTVVVSSAPARPITNITSHPDHLATNESEKLTWATFRSLFFEKPGRQNTYYQLKHTLPALPGNLIDWLRKNVGEDLLTEANLSCRLLKTNRQLYRLYG